MPTPIRAVPATTVKLGRDTVAQLRTTFPLLTVDDAVKSLLQTRRTASKVLSPALLDQRVAQDVVAAARDALQSPGSGIPDARSE